MRKQHKGHTRQRHLDRKCMYRSTCQDLKAVDEVLAAPQIMLTASKKSTRAVRIGLAAAADLSCGIFRRGEGWR